MKMFLQALSVMCACSFVTSCASKKSTQDKNQSVQIQDVGGDQTDIFAIPFDNSEEDEEIEIKNLEALGTHNKEEDLKNEKTQNTKPQNTKSKNTKPKDTKPATAAPE